jgi:hypothetical protein
MVTVIASLVAGSEGLSSTLTESPARHTPVPIIFDSDMDTDCDDLAALALLHVLADKGEATILATVASSRSEFTPLCIDAVNSYYGRPDLPIGVPKKGRQNPSKYTKAVSEAVSHKLKRFEDAGDAVEIYRRVLARCSPTLIQVEG